MIIDITENLSRAGASKTYPVEIDLCDISTASGTYSIIEKKPFEFTVVNEEDKRLHMFGETRVRVSVPCDRCLDEVEVEIPVSVDRFIPLTNGAIVVSENEDDEEILHFITDSHSVDCDNLVFDEILVNWPDKVLCKDDCKGLCPVCGQNLNVKDCGHDPFVPDPRMAGIQDIFKNFKEV